MSKEDENMAMDINGTYGNFSSTYVNNKETKRTKETKGVGETSKLSEAKKAESTQQTTQDYLNNLRKKYSDVNITVADFKNEKQELSYMLGSSGGNNIVILSSIIEKMAKDPVVAAKYEKVIEDVPNASKEIKEAIESQPGSKYIASGVKIDKDGKVTYWSVSSKTGEGPGTKEKMQKMLHEKRIEKKKQEKAEAKRKEEVEKQEALEEKQAEKKAAEKERIELMLAEGGSADEVVSAIENGETKTVSEIAVGGIDVGNRINLTV